MPESFDESPWKERVLCVVCGGSIGDLDTDESPQTRFRSFSFGPRDDETLVTVICMVCREHRDVDLLSIQRMVHNIMAQQPQHDTSSVRLEPRDA